MSERNHELIKQLARIGQRARVLLLLYGAAWVAGGLTLALAVFALADYLIRFEDRGIRMMCSLMILNLAGWLVIRYLWPAVRTRYSDVQLALRVERRYPQLADRLASTIQFLHQPEDDPLAGSAALRRDVIAETTAVVEPLNLADVLDPRPIRRALVVSGLICAGGLALAAIAPRYAAIALVRIANPLGSTAWPQTSHLVFTEAINRIALGSRFEVDLVDAAGAPLPREVRMHYRFEGEGEQAGQRVEPMKLVGNIMTAGMDNVLRPFEYRAEGGDDNTMPWNRLEVIEPPAIDQLTATLHYPAYTGWPPADSDPHLQALAGTRVALVGKTTKPIRSATVHVEHGSDFAARIREDRFGFELPADAAHPLVIRKSGTYTIELEDTEGFHGGQGTRYEIRAMEDRPPSVVLSEPATDTYVAAGAIVPIRALARDDLAIKQCELEATVASGAKPAGSRRLTLYEGPQQPTLPPTASSQNPPGESRPLELRLDLSRWKLTAGSIVSLRVSASDYRPAVAHSQWRRLTVLSPDELQDRLAERRGVILSELGRVLRLEQQSRAQLAGLEIQLDQVGKLQKQDLDHLQQAELTQRQVERGLARESDGVPAQVQQLLADLENNKIDNSDFQRRMQALLDELNRLGNDHLPPIARGLTAALKGFAAEQDSAGKPAPPAAPHQSLVQAGKHQDAVIQSLEAMLGDLAQWDHYRRFHHDVSQLKRDQEELKRQTEAVAGKTLTRRLEDLDPQQAADLKKLGQRQMELARHFDKLQQRMSEMAGQLRESDPLASDAVEDAMHFAREQALAGKMRDAGRDLERNQLGQAGKAQSNAQRGLEELLDILANRHERELDRLVKKLRGAEQSLEQFRRQQEGLRKKAAEAAGERDEATRRRELQRLARQQRELQQEVDRFARMLKRLQAQDASRSASRGGGKMGQAGDRAEQGDAQGAEQQAAAAKQELDDAQQQLAAARKAAESELAAEQLVRLDDQLKALRAEQERVLAETRHYDDLRSKNGRLSRAQAISVGQLARQQTQAREDTEALAKKLAAARVFELVLGDAAREMASAAERLEQRETAQPTQEAEQRALTRLAQIAEAIQGGPSKSGSSGGSGSGGKNQQQQQKDLPSVAELKLLKLMQQDLNERTLALAARRRGQQPLDEGQQRDFNELSRQQGQLADLLIDLVKPAAKPPDEGDELQRELKQESGGADAQTPLEEIRP